MDRRRFIKNATSFVTLPLLLNGHAISVLGSNAFNPANTNERALVLIQLDGGNDGLNTLIPLDMYENLVKVRPEVVIPENKILPLTDKQGLHPSFSEIKMLYEQEKLMFLQNVGYPQANLSHFRSKEIVLSASGSQDVVSSGWFGRYLETLHPEYPEGYPDTVNPDPLAITIGSNTSPTCQGDINNLGIVLNNLNTSYESQSDNQVFPDTPFGHELEYITEVMLKTEKYLEVVSETANKSETLSELWPEANQNKLADKLQVVARLITGGLQTPVFIVNLGGFDTHANQVVAGSKDTGKHADLLKLVSEACLAFQNELEIHDKEDKVISLVYSEFGRRIASNKSDGTDHGAAYPMMLFGSQVNPVVFGNNPDIPEEVSPKTNLPMDIDFRSVYASILLHWFEVDKSVINNILFNEFEILPLLKSVVGTADIDASTDELQLLPVYPNPVSRSCQIQYTTAGGQICLQLYSLDGKKISVLLNQSVEKGKHSVVFSRRNIPSGHYLLVLQNNKHSVTQAIAIQ